MKNLLHQISWNAYLVTLVIILGCYYAYIAWKYYSDDIRRLADRFSGRGDSSNALPEALQYDNGKISATATPDSPSGSYDNLPAGFTSAVSDLAGKLIHTITEIAGKPYAPSNQLTRLKKLLNDYPEIAATPKRNEINALIVRECEKSGTALLSEGEVDRWWSA